MESKYFTERSSNLEILTEWHEEFGNTPIKLGEIPSIPQRDKRIALIFEELTELADALGRNGYLVELLRDYEVKNKYWGFPRPYLKECNTNIFNKEEVLDACCDLEVVTLGAYNDFGFTEIAKEAYNETMESNFSKAANTLDEVNDSVSYYHKQGIETEGVVSPSKELIIIINSNTGKILKNQKTYKKPDYSKLLK